MMEFNSTLAVHDGQAELFIEGEIDSYSAPELSARLAEAIEQHKFVTLDLRAVEFMDSTGLGAFVGALKQARAAGGDLYVRGVTDKVRKVLAISGLDRIFNLPPD